MVNLKINNLLPSFYHIYLTSALRHTKARTPKPRRDSDYLDTEDDFQYPRHRLRIKQPVNYSKQLMPPNFTQLLDKEFNDFQREELKDLPLRECDVKRHRLDEFRDNINGRSRRERGRRGLNRLNEVSIGFKMPF